MSKIDTSTEEVAFTSQKLREAYNFALMDDCKFFGIPRLDLLTLADVLNALTAERDALRADLMRAQEVVRVMQGASAHLRPAATGAASGIHWATAAEKDAAVLRSRIAHQRRAQGQEQIAPRPCKAREAILRDVSGQAPAGTEYLDPGMGMAGDPGAGGE